MTDWRPVARSAVVGALLAVALRVVSAVRTPVINPDGAVELELARALWEGRWSDALALRFHPGYAALVALLGGPLGLDLETAGQVVSALSAAVLAGACAFAAARLCPERPRAAALVGGIVAACHPYLVRLGGQVMAYGVAHACLAVALAACLAAAAGGRLRWAAVAGGAVGCGYLARSDALATGLGLGVGLSLIGLRRRGGLARRLTLPTVFAAATLAAMSPYLVAIRAHSGEWRLSLKKRVSALVPAGEASTLTNAQSPEAGGPTLRQLAAREGSPAGVGAPGVDRRSLPAALRYALHVALATAHPLLVLLAVVGVAGSLRRERGPPLWLLPLLAAGVFVAVHALLKASPFGYTSRIHQSALGVLVAPLAARGVVAWRGDLPRRWQAGLALTLTALILLPKALEPQRLHLAPQRELGAWIAADAAQSPSGPLIVAGHDSRVVAHYANARFVELPTRPVAEAVAELRARGADYLVVQLSGRAPLRGELAAALAAEGVSPARGPLERLREGGKRYTWLVFRLHPESSGARRPG